MSLIFETWTSDLVATVLLLGSIAYLYTKHLFGYWNRRGVKNLPPTFPFGNFGDNFTQKISFAMVLEKLYKSMPNEKLIGTYATVKPMLLIRDPEIVRHILIKDFNSFIDRGNYIDETNDPLSGNLFSLGGEKWKKLRVKLSPVFTSGKLKAMFSTLFDCGVQLEKYMNKIADSNESVEVREIFARYTTNVISSIAFGIDINTIENPDAPFRHYGRKAVGLSFKNGLRDTLFFLWPSLISILRLKSVDDDVESFMLNLVKENIEFREKNNITRKDLFQLLLQLRNTGQIQADGIWNSKISSDGVKQLTFNEMAAQAWIFFVAGFETSSSTTSFCMYELAKNITLQRKVQEEITEVMERFNGQITYESISEMKYLEACIDETLRMYPSLPVLNRICNKEYHIPGTDVVVEKGTSIIIPSHALQTDEKYYKNPHTFEPERFLLENKGEKLSIEMPYYPFGDGPRNCIGMRLGKMQTKVGLVVLLAKYNFDLKSREKLVMSPKSILMAPIGGINLLVSKRV